MSLIEPDHDSASLISDLNALARVSFSTFVELCFPVLNPGETFQPAQYIDLLTHLLERCAARRCRRLIINLPPGFMKSTLVSILYVAWRLGVDPTAKFICISYGDDLAHHLSRKTRDLMLSPIYRMIFPNTVLDKKAEDHLSTTKGGYRYATAVGSDITGFRADEIIIDDPLQPADAPSEMAKEKVRSWVDTSVITRFKDHSNGVLIVVMHRLAPDDLSGTLEQRPGWEVIKLPLVAESTEGFAVAGDILMQRQPGDLLNPNRMTPEDLERLRNDIEPHVFASQYQQRPTAGGSGMCSIDRFERYDKPPPFELRIHSWDIAATPGGNFTVCTKWGVAKLPKVGDALFLTGVVRIRVELPDVRNTIIMHDKLDKPDLIVIDGGGVGLAIYQDLRRQGNRHVYKHGEIPDNPQSSPKIERFGKALLRIYDGKVRFPIAAPFLDLFFSEIAAFPNGKYDDQVDSMTQLVAEMRQAIRLARLKLRPR